MNMEMNITKITAFIILLVTLNSCELFELDNYKSPNGGIYGKIIDSETNNPIPLPVESSTGVLIQLYEIDTKDTLEVQPINFYANQDGTFTNTKVFNGKYNMLLDGPFVVKDNYPINVNIEGQTEINIMVTPYAHVNATADVNGKEVTISYEIVTTTDTVSFDRVYAYWNYQKLVDSYPNHFVVIERGSKQNGTFTFDLSDDEEFIKNKYKIEANGNRVYFRIGAQVKTKVKKTRITNYSETIEIIIP